MPEGEAVRARGRALQRSMVAEEELRPVAVGEHPTRVALAAAKAYVLSEFDGDVLAAFSETDEDSNGAVSASELQQLIRRVGLGPYWQRLAWAQRVIRKLDSKDAPDGRISPDELRRAFPPGSIPVEFKDVERCYDPTCIGRNGPLAT